MKQYLKHDDWSIIEEGFQPELNKISESIFSIGNGRMGQRANFEEKYSGDTLQGSYVAGVYYPDKTKVGWWKNGYPEYFAKVLNSVNWIGIDIFLSGEVLKIKPEMISNFKRELDMQHSLLKKEMKITTVDGYQFEIKSERFCSWSKKEIGAIQYEIKSLNYSGPITIIPYLDFDVKNQDSNYDEQFWENVNQGSYKSNQFVQAYTKKTLFEVRAIFNVSNFGIKPIAVKNQFVEMKALHCLDYIISENESIKFHKIVAICSSFNLAKEELAEVSHEFLLSATSEGYNNLKKEHCSAWLSKWNESDIVIEGDIAAQQGVRFNIFQLHQTYSGDDDRMNIGPKGFTGEKYGGSTYWDTEAYCLPFFLSNAPQKVSRNLLMYRFKQLDKAIENAEKLGFSNGAALYPMVTMNGEECHNEWEITFEEIHRNGAIAYAIFDYTRYTGSSEYLYEFGIDVLVAISRFWQQRVNWSNDKESYVMLGVTGPNEYENNVNNNWYTNYIASWCLRYTQEILNEIKIQNPSIYKTKVIALNLSDSELIQWQKINNYMYFPFDLEKQLYMQQDGFMDKEIIPASKLNSVDKPIHENWSWDRILRSCFIKQADVLQGMYFFEDDFDVETIRRHFEFYEPLTVHESSLSPCVHAILASKLEMEDKAYEMYLRTARLDLDDYNNDTEDGLHITSMAGSWMSIVKGFGGMKIKNGTLSFKPFIPKNWNSYSFKIKFRESIISVKVVKSGIDVEKLNGGELTIFINDEKVNLNQNKQYSVLDFSKN